jgi:hypothetical protein
VLLSRILGNLETVHWTPVLMSFACKCAVSCLGASLDGVFLRKSSGPQNTDSGCAATRSSVLVPEMVSGKYEPRW